MGLSALYWKEEVEDIAKIIRKNSDNLILIGPIGWSYDLFKIASNPIKDYNIAYSVHPYSIHKNWKENFELIMSKFPIVVTGWGFKNDTEEVFMKAGEEDYGKPILKFMGENNISWVAWYYDNV